MARITKLPAFFNKQPLHPGRMGGVTGETLALGEGEMNDLAAIALRTIMALETKVFYRI